MARFGLFFMFALAMGVGAAIAATAVVVSPIAAVVLGLVGLILFVVAIVLALGNPGGSMRWGLQRPRAEGQPRRIVLVAARDSVGSEVARELALRKRADDAVALRVISPSLDRRLEHVVGGGDEEHRAASARLHHLLAELHGLGYTADGQVGSRDPLVTLEDAIAEFGADEILIATHPSDEFSWLERDLANKIRERCVLPITHVVPDSPRDTRT